MGKPILYGMEISSVCRSVLLVAKEIGLEIDYREIDLFQGDHIKEEFLKMNPQHTVPTLDDNGFYLWESHAIIPYLVAKYAKNDNLYPKDDICKRAIIDQRMHFDNSILYGRLRDAVMPIYMKNSPTIDPEVIANVHKAYEFVEKFLEKDTYLVGNSMTIADFACVGNVSSLIELIPADPAKFPKMFAWLKRFEALPYYEEANAKGNREYLVMLRGLMAKGEAQGLKV